MYDWPDQLADIAALTLRFSQVEKEKHVFVT